MKSKLENNITNIIIGHTGYIGRTLLEEINKRDEEIIGISRNKINLEAEIKNKNFLEINTDIFNNLISQNLNIKSKPIIYICAHNVKTNFAYKRKSLEFVYNKNLNQYMNFIENIKILEPKKIIFLSSSGSLYDNSRISDPSDEKSILNPISEYGLSKFILENFLNNFSINYQIPLVICRVSTIYGNSFSKKKFGLLNYLIQCAFNKTTPILYGQDTYRDYLNIKDLIRILLEIGNRDLSSNLYNISYGESYSCLNIFNKVKNYLRKYNLQINQFDDKGIRLGENKNIFISSDKIKNETNWEPLININEGIKSLIIK
ncbi:MAG: hypothetical protein CL869_00415 [Cytophagia bacterium]|nr:hypothetical protein [Cytophagia bacterium]